MDSLIEQALSHEELQMMRPPWGMAGRTAVLTVTSGFAKVMLTMVNTFTVHNQQAWLDAVQARRTGTGLITYANHTSMFDDPGVICAMTPWSFFWGEPWHNATRWTLCAREVCFKNEFLRQFFITGKAFPVVRGEGVNQPVIKAASGVVARGGWVHVFPEGRINFSGQLGRFKWGVGKLICDARKQNGGTDPVVLPFYHSGMACVLPKGSWIFNMGREVTVNVGEPVDLSDITCRCNVAGEDQRKVWADITERMRQELVKLEERSPPNKDQSWRLTPAEKEALDRRWSSSNGARCEELYSTAVYGAAASAAASAARAGASPNS